MFKKKQRLDKDRSIDLGTTFLKKCRLIIACWILMLLTSIALVITLEVKGSSNVSTWIKAIFTTCCVIDILVTLRIIPYAFRIKKDLVFKEKTIRRGVRWIRATIIFNIIFVLSSVIWIWCAKSESTGDQVAKWVFAVVIIAGAVMCKGMFFSKYREIKKHIPTLFADPVMIKQEPSFPPPFPPSVKKLETSGQIVEVEEKEEEMNKEEEIKE